MKIVFVSLPVSISDNKLVMDLGAALHLIPPEPKKIRIFRASTIQALEAFMALLAGYSSTLQIAPEQLSQGTVFTEPTFANFQTMMERAAAGGYDTNIVVSSVDYAYGFFRYCVLNKLCTNEALMARPVTPERLLVYDDETRMFSVVEAAD